LFFSEPMRSVCLSVVALVFGHIKSFHRLTLVVKLTLG